MALPVRVPWPTTAHRLPHHHLFTPCPTPPAHPTQLHTLRSQGSSGRCATAAANAVSVAAPQSLSCGVVMCRKRSSHSSCGGCCMRAMLASSVAMWKPLKEGSAGSSTRSRCCCSSCGRWEAKGAKPRA